MGSLAHIWKKRKYEKKKTIFHEDATDDKKKNHQKNEKEIQKTTENILE